MGAFVPRPTKTEALHAQSKRLIAGPKKVYVIGAAGYPLKIGVAKDPYERLGKLQTSYHHPLVLHYASPPTLFAAEIEERCHDALDSHRLHGEWFDLSPDKAVSVVAGVVARHL